MDLFPTLDLYSQAWMRRDFGKLRSEVGVLHTRSENEDGGREVKEGEYQSEERNLVFEQGQECPARGGISAGEEGRASEEKQRGIKLAEVCRVGRGSSKA